MSEHPEQFDTHAHAHNNFLQIGAEFGLPALFFFIAMWSVFVWESLADFFSTGRTDEKTSFYGRMITGATVALLLAGLFEYNFGDSEVMLTFWFLSGLWRSRVLDLYPRSTVRF